MSDLLFQNLSTVQSLQQPMPVTVASTTTIAPTTFLTFVTGTIDVTTITPPVTGCHVLQLQFTDASPGDILTTGNVLIGSTTVAQYSIVQLTYNPIAAKYLLAKLT